MNRKEKRFALRTTSPSITTKAKQMRRWFQYIHNSKEDWRFSLQEMFWATACFAVAMFAACTNANPEFHHNHAGLYIMHWIAVTCGVAMLTNQGWLAFVTGLASTFLVMIIGPGIWRMTH
jgi:tellurite resistance protein TehA-like permease